MRRADPEGMTRAAREGLDQLRSEDPGLFDLLAQEYRRQNEVLAMVAASSIADLSVLACTGTAAVNVTTEGYPGARLHAGCEVVDEIERMAVARAKEAFGARYANVQPHSGSSANAVVLFSLLQPGDTILGLSLGSGGHFTHGADSSVSGRYYRAVGYEVDADGRLDYGQILRLARRHRPKLLICGASCHPRHLDFARFRAIADEVGAWLLADISHVAGLVAAGEHPSPIDHAHFTTTSTYKQLYGPRGGLILMGRDAEQPAPGGTGTLAELIQRGVFPLLQGTPNLAAIAGKARALARVATPGFRVLARRIVADARALADALLRRGYRLLTGGTDNHLLLIDLRERGLSGLVAEQALEHCGIVINKMAVPGDPRSDPVVRGIRLGTNNLAARGMGPETMERCAELVDQVLTGIEARGDRDFVLPGELARTVREQVAALCRQHPIPGYPVGQDDEVPTRSGTVALGR